MLEALETGSCCALVHCLYGRMGGWDANALREEVCLAAFLFAYIRVGKISRWMRVAQIDSVDEVRLQWPGYPSCCLLQLVRMLFDHRICLLDYEKTRERGVHYNPQQRLPDQTTILRGVVSLHLHDTRKPLPNEDVSRPHEKPSDPYWEGHCRHMRSCRIAAQTAFILVLATMTRSRVVVSAVAQFLLQSPLDEVANLVQMFDWAALRRTPNVWLRNVTYDTRTGSFLQTSARLVEEHVAPVYGVLRKKHFPVINGVSVGHRFLGFRVAGSRIPLKFPYA